MLTYGSVCSGIEAASVAWEPLGFHPAFFSEIERFPSEVLAHHYGSNLPGETWAGNGVPNHGDMTNFKEWPDHAIDLLVGGTPCQSFSVAGLRAGLADPRGNLMLTYLAIAARYRPRWLVWENVPGVLSSWSCPEETDDLQAGQEREVEEVSDFGCLLEGFQQLGYGFAYRVLDAQYVRVGGFARAVPQRRRRVFVVGYFGDWRRAAAVLFDGASLRGDSAPRREAGQGVAGTVSASAARRGGVNEGERGSLIAGTIDASAGRSRGAGVSPGALIAFGGNRQSGPLDVATAVNAHGGPAGRLDFESETFVAHPIAAALDASYGRLQGASGQDMNHGHSHLVPIAFHGSQDPDISGDVTHPLGRNYGQEVAVAIPFDTTQITSKANYSQPMPGDPCHPLAAHARPPTIATNWAVRRLTPLECERLQGFPDGYTDIPRSKGKPAADGPRYKGLGNSMACNVMRWLGERIALVDAL